MGQKQRREPSAHTERKADVDAPGASRAEPKGLLGTMSPEAKEKYDAKMHARVNHDSDNAKPVTGVRPAMKGRDADADVEAFDGDAFTGSDSSRVGTRTVEHPRKRTALALHEWLSGRSTSDLTAEEASEAVGQFAMHVDGTGSDGAILKSDNVRAMDELLAAHYPARSA